MTDGNDQKLLERALHWNKDIGKLCLQLTLHLKPSGYYMLCKSCTIMLILPQ